MKQNVEPSVVRVVLEALYGELGDLASDRSVIDAVAAVERRVIERLRPLPKQNCEGK